MNKPKKLPFWKKAAIGATIIATGVVNTFGGSLDSKIDEKIIRRPILPVTPPVKWSAEVEYEHDFEKGVGKSRLELLRGRDYVARLERSNSEGFSRDRYGMKISLNKDLFKGYVDLFGAEDSLGNDAQGVNWEGLINKKYLFGGALERAETNGQKDKVFNIYGGMHLGDIQFSVGGARVEKGNDKRDVFHGTFFKKYDNFIFGLGGQTDNKNDTYAHFVFGQHPKEKGKGFGWRVLGFSELEGDFTAELMLTLDSNFSKWSYYGIADPYTYFHEKKMRITDNVMDYFIPATELFKRTNGTAALEFNFNKDNKGNQSLLIDSAVYPTGVLRKLGMDIGKGPLDNVWIGGGYNTGKKQGIFKAGIRHKDFIVYGTKPEGERPALSFGFYRGF